MDFFANFPALPPPPGVLSNFNSPDTLAPSLIAVNATFLSLMIIAVAIRLYSRGLIVHALGWDDYTCVLAALCSIAHTTMGLRDIHYQFGRHLWDIRAISLLPSHIRSMDSLGMIYAFAIFFTKFSISMLYLRIFSIQRTFRYFVYVGILSCALTYTAYSGISIATIIQCASPSSLTLPICAHAQIITIVLSVINVCTDLYILALPIGPILNLKLRRRQKIGLLAVFLSGLVACAVSITRLVFAGIRVHNPDTLYFAALTSELSVVELNVAIATSSMAAMPQFFAQSKIFQASTYRRLRARLFGERVGTGSSGIAVLSNNANGGSSFPRENKVSSGKDYLELQELPRAHTVAERSVVFGGDNDSSAGISKMTTFDVISGPNSKRHSEPWSGQNSEAPIMSGP